jgi:hypothetical protein
MDWRHRAACRGADPELFFPTAEASPLYERAVAAAKAVCAGCPVRAECLDFAFAALPCGIAGGLTEDERRDVARRADRRRASIPAVALGPAPTQKQTSAAGQALLAQGRPVAEVAAQCGVTTRTAQRWARRAAAATSTPPARAATPPRATARRPGPDTGQAA